jgi:hypothetical protein
MASHIPLLLLSPDQYQPSTLAGGLEESVTEATLRAAFLCVQLPPAHEPDSLTAVALL